MCVSRARAVPVTSVTPDLPCAHHASDWLHHGPPPASTRARARNRRTLGLGLDSQSTSLIINGL